MSTPTGSEDSVDPGNTGATSSPDSPATPGGEPASASTPAAAGQGATSASSNAGPVNPSDGSGSKGSGAVWVVLALIAVIVLGAGAFMLVNQSNSSKPAPAPTAAATAEIPDVVGMNEAAASNALVAAGFMLGDVIEKPTSDVPSGTVIAQSPEPGRQVQTGSKVSVQVAKDNTVAVPDLRGMTQAQATNTLLSVGLQLGAVTVQSDAAPADTVLTQDPKPGTSTPSSAPVNIVVSNGKQKVPDVIGKDEGAARALVTEAGYVVDVVTVDTKDEAENGVVIKTNPPAGKTVVVGSTVVLTVGKFVPSP